MIQEKLSVANMTSERSEISGLILTVKLMSVSDCHVIIGCPGLPNERRNMEVGDVVLFQTPLDGVLEVRLGSLKYPLASFYVTQVSPSAGIFGADDGNLENSPFNKEELERIADATDKVREKVRKAKDFEQPQIDLILGRLDEMQKASYRLGRKDWIMYAAGTITSLVTDAAFSPDATKRLFGIVSEAFSWLFQVVKFISS